MRVAGATAWVEVGADQAGAELGRRDVQDQGQLLVSHRPAERGVLAQGGAHLQQPVTVHSSHSVSSTGVNEPCNLAKVR